MACDAASLVAPALRLLNDFQRDFPLCARPYAAMAERLGTSEARVMSALSALTASGAVSRLGATIAAGRVGAATLAALEVPAERLQAVADEVSAWPEVNHNYARDHRYNLWFVVTAPSAQRLRDVLGAIERRAACGPLLDLPMVEAYHVDLGFDLTGGAAPRAAPCTRERYAASAAESRLLAALQDGLPLVSRPYAALGAESGLAEDAVLDTLRGLVAAGVVRRFGVIVAHHALGYRANAMAVWDVPDEIAASAGARLARASGVTLCYRRRRDAGRWPYNVYCMVHGSERAAVSRRVAAISAASGVAQYPGAVLFSTRRFKQCAARYVAESA